MTPTTTTQTTTTPAPARVSDEAGMVSRAAVAARRGRTPYWQNDPRHTQLP